MEKDFSVQQSLEVIESMINQAKNKFNNDSPLYLLWGWIVLICSVGNYLLYKFQLVEKPHLIWLLLFVALIVQIIYLIKQHKKEKVKTYIDEILGYIWTSFGITMFLISFVVGQSSGNWINFYPTLLILYGIPTFLSGAVMRFLPLKIGGICCWALAITTLFISKNYYLLIIALAVIIAWIIPGYLMKSFFKKQSI
ncbi:MAG: hypothetical protein LC122_00730 [Chitinophagales bacterium]|nr:hypothetical protein [Chitinophagales bacterium]